MPTGDGAGKAKIFINRRVREISGLPQIILKFGHRGEYGMLLSWCKKADTSWDPV
jgi:hypothetical protein